MIQTLRVAHAAIRRYQIERPIRVMWTDLHPVGSKGRAKMLKRQFSSIVDTLRHRGYIEHDDYILIQQEYSRLSEIIHGRFQ